MIGQRSLVRYFPSVSKPWMLTSRGLNKGIRGLSSNLVSSAASLLLCTRVELLHSIVHTRGDARSSRLHCFLGAQRIWDSSWERILLRILLFLSGLLVKVRVHGISRVMKNECAKREKWRSGDASVRKESGTYLGTS